MIVNRTQIGEIFGWEVKTVDARVKDGMPFLARPGVRGAKGWQFSPKDCIAWVLEKAQKGSKTDRTAVVNLRILEADATMKEIRVAGEQKRLVAVERVGALVETKLSIVKSRLTAIPGRLHQAVAVENDPAVVLRLIKDEVNEALDEISSLADLRRGSVPPPTEAVTEDAGFVIREPEDDDDNFGY
jgi:phage terminase Nu1 subunit (DNA packaging protein)